MKTGTTFKIELIADDRFLGNCKDVETLISIKRSSLKTAIHNEGIEIYNLCSERVLDKWSDGSDTKQIRQEIVLILSKPKSKNDIYKIINQVRAQPIKFN